MRVPDLFKHIVFENFGISNVFNTILARVRGYNWQKGQNFDLLDNCLSDRSPDVKTMY